MGVCLPGSSPAPLSVPCCCDTALGTEGGSWNVRQLPRNEHQCLQAGAYRRRSHHEVFWRPGQRAAPSKSFSLCGGVVRGCATLVRLGLCGVVRLIWRTSSQFGSGMGSEQVPSMQPKEGPSMVRMVLKFGLYDSVQVDDTDLSIR